MAKRLSCPLVDRNSDSLIPSKKFKHIITLSSCNGIIVEIIVSNQ